MGATLVNKTNFATYLSLSTSFKTSFFGIYSFFALLHFAHFKQSSMNIHVSNLSHNTGDGDLRKLFSSYGEVISAVVLRDKLNGRSRGTAFVDMINDSQGLEAISGLHRTKLDGKSIAVIERTYSPSKYKDQD